MDALGHPPLTGRVRETAQLSGCFARLDAGLGTLLFVVADGGMGKSRMATEAVRLAASRGVATGWGRGRLDGATPTLVPWAEALAGAGVADLFALVEASGGDRRVVGDEVVDRLRLAAPVALVLDDLDDADDATLAFLGDVAGHLSQLAVVVVATFRPDSPARRAALGRLLRQVGDEPACDFLELEPLAVDEAIECAQAMSERRLAPERVIAVVARSSGNPFLVGELLGATSGGVETSLPRTALEVLATRLAGLGPAIRRPLEALAVLGGAADMPILARVAGILPEDAAGLATALGPASAARLITSPDGLDRLDDRLDAAARGRESGPLVEVTHALVREALIAGLDVDTARELHRRALDVLATAQLDPGVQAEAMAHHGLAAGVGDAPVGGDEPGAHLVALALDAARWCLRRGGPENAVQHLARVLDTPAGRAQRAELTVVMGEAQLAAGWAGDARKTFEDALGAAVGDAGLIARARSGILACVEATQPSPRP